MEAFFVSVTTISIAEIGDRTQLLSLVLVARYRRALPIIAGIFCATLANHAVAGAVGVWFGNLLRPKVLEITVGVSMIAMALWTLKPDKLDADASPSSAASAFVATLTLAAAYPNLLAVVSGTTLGMLIANVPVVILGKAFADRLPIKAIHYGASALFMLLGALFLGRALWR